MKTLITIILIHVGLTATAQTDKVAHFGVGYIVGATSNAIVLTNSNGKNEWIKSVSVGLLSGALIGTAKEIYDYKDYGLFDWKDLGATVLGSTLGSVTIKLSINRYEKKHLL